MHLAETKSGNCLFHYIYLPKALHFHPGTHFNRVLTVLKEAKALLSVRNQIENLGKNKSKVFKPKNSYSLSSPNCLDFCLQPKSFYAAKISIYVQMFLKVCNQKHTTLAR